MELQHRELRADLFVAGGGLAGICAALAAARHGLSVVLCQDRPVLGGNSSSECRVWVCGATGTGNNRYAEESGIINELILENLHRNREGNPYLWDALLLETVLAEKNITLLLNTRVSDAHVEHRRLFFVECTQFTTETRYTVFASLFADCTGDGFLARCANADYVYGTQDAQADARIAFSPESDVHALGDSLLFYVKKQPHPVAYTPPSFAYPKSEVEKYLEDGSKSFRVDNNGCDYWWLEFGGQNHIVADSEAIMQTLRGLVFGLWDYIKNSGRYEAECLSLEWVGSFPARRESYRIRAVFTLTHNDILERRRMPDAVCHGGWPIDTHPARGFFEKTGSCRQVPINIYDIPLRSLCCARIDNLLLGGRDAGMTHLAMASARVMKTCALMGQAIGTAAAIGKECGVMPTQFSNRETALLQSALARDDVWIVGRINDDPLDAARTMRVDGDAGIPLDSGGPEEFLPMTEDVYILLPPLQSGAAIHLWIEAAQAVTLSFSVFDSVESDQYLPSRLCQTYQSRLCVGRQRLEIVLSTSTEGNTVIHIPWFESGAIGAVARAFPGALGVFSGDARGLNLFTPALGVRQNAPMFEPSAVVDGYNRPFGGMHLWASALHENGASIELSAESPIWLTQIHLFLDCGLYRDYNNLRPGASLAKWAMPHENLAKTLKIQLFGADGRCAKTIDIQENHQRHVVCAIKPIHVTRVRITVLEAWGGTIAAIHEIRLYEEEASNRCPN